VSVEREGGFNSGPQPETIRLQQTVQLSRTGVDRTQLFFSYSGGMVVTNKLDTIAAELDGNLLEIAPPIRLASPYHRPNPELTFETSDAFQCEFAPSVSLTGFDLFRAEHS
jgi:hypothetical protein